MAETKTPLPLRTKSVLPWFGSDASVAPQLAAMLDGCKHVTIPFAGGMSILPHLKAKAIVANDLHSLAHNFYLTLSGRYGQYSKTKLIDHCLMTLSHPSDLARAIGILDGSLTGYLHESAWAFWAVCWIGRKGKGGTKHQGGKPSVRRTANGGNNATRIQSASADLEAWAEEFKRCEFTCEDFRECLSKVADNPSCGIYVDAPWFGAGRNYLHSFTQQDHECLMNELTCLNQTKVVVRYGDCKEVREMYDDLPWTIIEATSRTQANKRLGELWITNFEVAS